MAFAAGNKAATGGARPGAGRKSDELRRQLATLIDEAIPAEDWRDIFKMLSCRARAGDDRCAALLLDRKFGKAPQVVEIDEPDEQPADLTRLSDEDLKQLGVLLRKASPVVGSGEASPDDRGDRGGAAQPAVPAGPNRLRKRGPKGRFLAEAD